MRTRYTAILAVAAAAVLNSGCGILPRVAQQTTAAAIAPVTTAARAVSQSLQVTSQNIAASSMAAERTSRQLAFTAAQARGVADQRRRYAQRLAERNDAAGKRAAPAPSEPEVFDILPAATLAQLTRDQAALQRALQKEALTAPVGETIFWEHGGRTGTAMTEDEHPFGGFICRTFVQTVRLEADTETRGSVFACRSLDGAWEPSLARTEPLQ